MVLLKCGNLRITVVDNNKKRLGDLPLGAAIYGMRITSLYLVGLHRFLYSAYNQLTMALSQGRNLLRRINLSGDLTDDCVNNFMSFYE